MKHDYYQITMRRQPAHKKIHRDNFPSDDEYDTAMSEANGKMFFVVDIVDGEDLAAHKRRLHSPIVQDDEWEFGLKMTLQAIRLTIAQHEGVDLVARRANP